MNTESRPYHPDLIDDEQINDEYYLLGITGKIDRETVQILKEVRKQLPYKDGDFKYVEVEPFKDDLVNYTEVLFDFASILERDELLYSEDEQTIFIEKLNARTLAQIGVLFDVKIQEFPQSQDPVVTRHEEDLSDRSSLLTNHTPDLQVISGNYTNVYTFPSGNNNKSHIRKRNNVREMQEII